MAFFVFGGGARRAMPNRPLMQAMWQANQALASGQAGQAAAMFAQVAQQLENRGFPRRAANVHAQAARAWMQAKNEAAALDQARVAMNEFLALNMPRRAATFYRNAVRSMTDNGLKGAADTFQKEYSAKVEALGVRADPAQTGRGRLPAKCPQCGAPARSDEVEWIDNTSAECVYCGSVIRTE